jgi:hypothetical protein
MNNRNLIITLAVVALLTLAATTAGCSTTSTPSPTPIAATQTTVGNNTTFSSAAGFNITYPKTLKTDNSSDALTPVRVYIYLNPNTTVDGVNVVTTPLASGKTLSDYEDFALSGLETNASLGAYRNFTILNETNLTFAGQPAHKIVFSAIVPQQINQTLATNKSIKTTQIWLVNNNTGYTVAYKALANDYDTYLAQAERIMNSFVLT